MYGFKKLRNLNRQVSTQFCLGLKNSRGCLQLFVLNVV